MKSSGSGEKREAVAGTGAPRPPGDREEPAQLSSLGDGPARAAGATEALIDKMAEHIPYLRAVISATTVAARLRIVEENLAPQQFGKLVLQLSTILFFYEAKDKKIPEALGLAQLQLELAKRIPPQPPDQADVDFTAARHIADALNAVARQYLALGSAAKALENYREAEKYFVQDQEERSTHGLPVMSEWDRVFNGRAAIAIFYENLGQVYRELGDDAASADCWARMRRYESGNLTPQVKFQRSISAGLGAESEGNMDAALAAYQTALDESLAMSGSTMVTRNPATACHHLGEVLARLGLYRRALWYHGQARQLNVKSGHLERLQYDHKAIGRIYRKKPRYGDALAEFESALRCVSVEGSPTDLFSWTGGGVVYRVLNPDLAWDAALEIGRLHRSAGHFPEAERFLQLSINLSEAARSSVLAEQHRIGVQGERASAYDAMVGLHAQRAAASGGEERARHSRLTFEFAERSRGRAFLDSLGNSPIAAPGSVPGALCSAEAEWLDRLRALREKASGATAVWDEYAAAQQELDQVWGQIAACGEDGADYVAMRRGQPLDWTGLRKMTASETGARQTVVAEYFDTGDEFLLLLAAPDDQYPRVIPLPLDRQAVGEAVQRYLQIGEGPSGRDLDLARLQEPLQPLLDAVLQAASRGDLLWFVPHGILHRVPMHAFDAGGEPLLERNPVCYSPSASVMKYCRTNRHAKRESALLLADSRGDMPLPHAREQVLAIRPFFSGPTQAYVGESATRSRVNQAIASSSGFDVVHLACHGVFHADNPLASGILLAPETTADDAVWTARDLLAVRLPVDLMTLSACQSGLNETRAGEELLGLTRAILHAGAATVAVSNWSVDEVSTSILMSCFYEAMAADADKAEALRRAASRLRRMTVEEAIAWCRQARQGGGASPDLPGADLLEEDIAAFEFQARDFKPALDRYTAIRANLEPGSSGFRRISVKMSRCRLALQNPGQVDYTVQPFRHPYYWAPFALVGSWS